MTDTATLQSLLERVEAATGPDRALDGEIAFATQFRPTNHLKESFDLHEAKHGYVTSWIAHQTWRNQFDEPKYTASIDAALALVEQLLPGIPWGIDRTDEGDPEVWFDASVGPAFAQMRTAPLAILAALLKALIAESP